MTENNCNDINKVLTDPNCNSDYVTAYNNYISKMNNYCSENDNILTNEYCNLFIHNNPFIQNTPIKTTLEQKAILTCTNTPDSTLLTVCKQKYNITPQVIINAEKKAQEDKKKVQDDYEKAQADNGDYMFILYICLVIFVVEVIVFGYRRYRNNNNTTTT
jgi:hypothetical protein